MSTKASTQPCDGYSKFVSTPMPDNPALTDVGTNPPGPLPRGTANDGMSDRKHPAVMRDTPAGASI